MSAQPLQPPKHYAKLICHYLKTLPDKYANDPQDVQDVLGLSDAEFRVGVNWCVARKLITLDKPLVSAPSTTLSAAPAAAPKPASSSPFVLDDDEDETIGAAAAVSAAFAEDDDDEDETIGDRESVFGAEPASVG